MVGLILGQFLGEAPISSGFFAGLSVLAVVAAMNDTNGGLYMALMGQFGKPRDVAAYSVMTIESGPFLTMVTLGVAGLSAFPWQTLVGAVLPLLVGAILGNLDKEMRVWLGSATGVLIPFFAFALGASIDLGKVWTAGLLGLLFGVAMFVVTGAVLIVADKLTGGTGVAGIAAASTAGNAAAVPAIVASANPAYQAAAGPATVLVAASVVVTALLVPVGTAFLASRQAQRRGPEEDVARDVAERTPAGRTDAPGPSDGAAARAYADDNDSPDPAGRGPAVEPDAAPSRSRTADDQ